MSDPLLKLTAGSGGRRRGGGRGRVLAVLLLGVLGVGAVIVLDGVAQDARTTTEPDTARVDMAAGEPVQPVSPAPGDVEAADQLDPVAGQSPLGVADGLGLVMPASDPVLVSYHEASFPEALPVAPAGTLVRNDNATRAFDEVGPDGPDYLVQVSRGRRQGPTTAVDVVMRPDDPVLSPIAGTVTEVRPYSLYGTHDDVRLELVPDDHPDLRVVLIHVEDVTLAPGDRVEVGDVLAGNARLFSFEAVVDRQVADALADRGGDAARRFGHVHIEVKRPAPDADEDR